MWWTRYIRGVSQQVTHTKHGMKGHTVKSRTWTLVVTMGLLCSSQALAETVTYDFLGASDASARSIITATQQQISWHGTLPANNMFANLGRFFPASPRQFTNESGIWSVTNGGHTTFTTNSGVLLLDGLTGLYEVHEIQQLPSRPPDVIFRSDFTGAFLHPGILGGIVTTNEWSGEQRASFENLLPPGFWEIRARSTPQQLRAIPEPGTWILLMTGIGVLMFIGWKRRSLQSIM